MFPFSSSDVHKLLGFVSGGAAAGFLLGGQFISSQIQQACQYVGQVINKPANITLAIPDSYPECWIFWSGGDFLLILIFIGTGALAGSIISQLLKS